MYFHKERQYCKDKTIVNKMDGYYYEIIALFNFEAAFLCPNPLKLSTELNCTVLEECLRATSRPLTSNETFCLCKLLA